jgi:hypothetical protein
MAEEEKREEVTQEEKPEKEKPLEKMTAKELREIALGIPDVSGVHAMKKEQLLEVVKDAKGIPEEQPAKKPRKKALKQELSARELKQKIIQFKEKKEAARLAKESRTVDILRRRINRLKKRTRKVAQA